MHPPWTLSASSEHNSEMQDLTYTSIPQHKDSAEACIKGDSFDLEKMHTQIITCSPYTANPTLRNMVNKIVAGSDENGHAVEALGKNIIRNIIGNS
ncbi:hypothetical protein DPMN_072585 [Dreissena polymorpha]|uniref:Uncharacterized protein n=1 Tax=Dreissena polymorpha TaxID=45954 RepID=A0A9D3Z4U2_DREPO|nr:hypothetical protein DPMN_072585 [Dreissena polymorpha]